MYAWVLIAQICPFGRDKDIIALAVNRGRKVEVRVRSNKTLSAGRATGVLAELCNRMINQKP